MCNWKNWIWPGVISTAALTAVTGWFLSNPVEQDLTTRAGSAMKTAMPWATIGFDGRDATISGVAESESLQSDAATMALATYGVRVVTNAVTLPQTANPFVFNVSKNANGVTLTGNYESSESRAKIVSAAEVAMPGIAITDEMTLATGKPTGFDELAAFAVGQVADLTEGVANLSNTDYSIKGAAADVVAYENILAETAQLPTGAVLKAADLAIPALGRPYEFDAAIVGNAVNMTGYAPSQNVKASLEADVKAAFPDKTVNNLLKLAAGAPSNFTDLVKFGLGQMATLGNGSFSLADASYSIKGTPANADVFNALTKQVSENLPEGASLALADLVKPVEPAPVPVPEPYTWSAAVADGALKIEGTSPSLESAQAAIDLAKRRFVKTEVTDAQTVLDGAPSGFADAQANSLKVLSYLTNGKAAIVDKMVTIEGSAPSESVLKLANTLAHSGLPAGFELVSKVNVVAPAVAPVVVEAVKPYVWSATSNKDGIKLEGAVLSSDVGAAILSVATSSFVGKAVSNAQTPQNPSPAGFAAVQTAALQGLSLLQEGTVTITDKVVNLSGISDSDEVKLAAQDLIGKALPDGYSLQSGSLAVAAPTLEPAPASEPAATPYMWMASSGAAGVKLDGSIPSSEVGTAALALAQKRFVKTDVTETQTVTQGAPDGFAEAQAASLKALSYLTEGRAIQSDKAVDISGIAASESIKALVIGNATSALPKDYVLTTNIAVATPVPQAEPIAAAGDCLTQVGDLLNAEQIGFESNKADVLESSKPLIGKIASALATCADVRMEIAGHTDSDGSDAYNQRLSHDRAHAVRRALVAAGVPFGRMLAKGYGEKEPIADNDTAENKAKNRRTEFRPVQ